MNDTCQGNILNKTPLVMDESRAASLLSHLDPLYTLPDKL